MRLHDFHVLSFDCYGTLIDWESGIFAALAPLITHLPSLSRDAALEAFGRQESAVERANPGLRYSLVLADVYRRLAAEWDVSASAEDAEHFGASVHAWPAFEDTPAALQYLKRHYKLVILSNIDHVSFAGSEPRLGVAFDAVFTAEDIGSYKPDAANFRYMLARLAEKGIEKRTILHTAQSLYHDHVPAKQLGFTSCWIDRRGNREGFGATPAPAVGVQPDFHFPSLQAMAEAHRAEVGRTGETDRTVTGTAG